MRLEILQKFPTLNKLAMAVMPAVGKIEIHTKSFFCASILPTGKIERNITLPSDKHIRQKRGPKVVPGSGTKFRHHFPNRLTRESRREERKLFSTCNSASHKLC